MVAPGFAHHVTQRGNRGLRTFFSDEDHEVYIGLMRASGAAATGSRCGATSWTSFVERPELLLDRPLLPRRPGRRPMNTVQ
jgi:hypothetical protein